MEVRIYDAEFNLKKIIENHTSLLWKRKYNDVGEFTLTCPATLDNVNSLLMDRIVWVEGKVEAGVIENINMRQNNSQNILTVNGRFLESYMDRRLIKDTLNFSGTVENAMRQILTDATPLPMVQLDDLQGFTESVDFQATYKNLLDYEKKLAKSAAFGFRFQPDFVNKTITFKIYKGLDHSIEQSDRPRVIFSDEYANLTSTNYNANNQLFKNICYVSGEGEEWRDKKIVICGDDSLTGLERRETYHDGSDLTSNGLTLAQYEATLIQRGYDVLETCVQAEAFSCDINPDGNFKYLKNYDIGDIVTIQKSSWGVYGNRRITEITEVYERGLPTIQPVLGDTLPETIDWGN